MDGQHDTRDGSSKLTRRTAKNFPFPHGLQYAKRTQNTIIILTGEDDTTGFDSWRYSTLGDLERLVTWSFGDVERLVMWNVQCCGHLVLGHLL